MVARKAKGVAMVCLRFVLSSDHLKLISTTKNTGYLLTKSFFFAGGRISLGLHARYGYDFPAT